MTGVFLGIKTSLYISAHTISLFLECNKGSVCSCNTRAVKFTPTKAGVLFVCLGLSMQCELVVIEKM